MELYDLASDPAETRNLVAEMPDKASAMVQTLDEWVAEHRADADTPDPFTILMPHWELGGAIF